MAIFTNDGKSNNGNTGTTIIATGTKINGQIDIDCNLHIDGEFEGVINSKNFVTIGKSGFVSGDIFASKLIVSGKYEGSCECDVVEILPQGRIEGKITSKELVIERKGYFIGESKIKSDIKKVEATLDSKQSIQPIKD